MVPRRTVFWSASRAPFGRSTPTFSAGCRSVKGSKRGLLVEYVLLGRSFLQHHFSLPSKHPNAPPHLLHVFTELASSMVCFWGKAKNRYMLKPRDRHNAFLLASAFFVLQVVREVFSERSYGRPHSPTNGPTNGSTNDPPTHDSTNGATNGPTTAPRTVQRTVLRAVPQTSIRMVLRTVSRAVLLRTVQRSLSYPRCSLSLQARVSFVRPKAPIFALFFILCRG